MLRLFTTGEIAPLVLHLFHEIILSFCPNPPLVCVHLLSLLIPFSSPCIIPDRPPALLAIMHVMFLFLVAVLWLLLQMSAPSPPSSFPLFFFFCYSKARLSCRGSFSYKDHYESCQWPFLSVSVLGAQSRQIDSPR